jgi:hypothetical protein
MCKESEISFPTKLFKIRLTLKLNLFGTRGQKSVIAVDVKGRQRLSAFSVDHQGSGVNQIGILRADF